MIQEAETILSLLHKKKFDAFYIGGKCRNELHNQYHSNNKVSIKDIDIVTNANIDEVKKIFPRAKVRGGNFQVLGVLFGGHEFEIATYRKDIYDKELIKNSSKIVKPETCITESLDEDRERRDYTINAIAQDVNGNYIDYTYKYRNKKISAMQDIKDGIIRAIGNPRLRFEEDPLRIFRAFRFMAQLGYEIETQTLKAIQKNLELIKKIPHERISMEMNKLILGIYANDALNLMKDIGVFNIKINDKRILPDLNNVDFTILNKLNSDNTDKDNITEIEAWTVLLKPLGPEKAKENLLSIQALKNDDIEKVEWLIQHFELINSDDLKNEIYYARTGIVKRYKLMCLKELIQRLGKIHIKLEGKEYIEKSKKLMQVFCSRPYFPEQLKVTGEDLIKIADEEPGPWVKLAKEKLIFKLINTDKFPKEEENYMDIVIESVEEAFAEELMKEEGLFK